MERRIQLKFLGILVGAIVLAAPLGYVVHGFQVKRTASFYLNQSEKAQKEGDLNKAIEYLARFLAFYPHHKDAQAQFGLLKAHDSVAKTPRALERAYLTLNQSLRLN